MSKDDLRHADLSHLSITEMTPAQRAELKRRYSHFVESFVPANAKLPDLRSRRPSRRSGCRGRRRGGRRSATRGSHHNTERSS